MSGRYLRKKQRNLPLIAILAALPQSAFSRLSC
jgi:hypothetical protein